MLRLSATQTPTTTTTTRSVTASQPQPQATLHATASHSHSDGDDDDGGGGWTDAPANKRRQRSTLAATSSTRTQPRQTHATRVQQTSAVRIAGTPSSAARVARPGLLPLPANAVPTDLMTTTAGASTSSSHSSTSSHGVGGAVPGNGKNARGRALTIADLISIATNMSNPKRTNKTIRSEVTPATASVSQITRRRVLAMAPTAQAALPRHAAAASSKFNGRSAHPNKLDGSSPAIRAGKQSRATTKRHRPSRMRKIIRRDRQLRKRVALAGKASASSSAAATESAVLQPSSPQTAPAMPEAVASTSTTATQDSRPGNSSDMHQASTSASEMETREKDNNGDDDAGDDEFDPEVIAAERLTATMHRFRITSSAMKHHSARFREYCSQKVGAELDSATAIVLKQLHKFQERRLATIDPNKAKQRRWFVVGLKEVFKHLQRGKLRCLIVAPDIESVRSAGKMLWQGCTRFVLSSPTSTSLFLRCLQVAWTMQ
ncbi:hypothetical protein, variant [Capsaspora owczarzaki ATCC 30864]|uniref:Ribosomal protein L7Ae/L30e/S12e/Gadd45 domain-containing protein n=1 Tax=Capsaspora owczarzaki (strain ATCC 30864) TaxID=595528 RepID=A0A0D2WWQ2_CAPO3|nr:hypothetical protein, variant [Capsaspora owczarzaki ATCC 30864]